MGDLGDHNQLYVCMHGGKQNNVFYMYAQAHFEIHLTWFSACIKYTGIFAIPPSLVGVQMQILSNCKTNANEKIL